MARTAKISFPHSNRSLSVFDLKDILMDLPSDSKIIGMVTSFPTYSDLLLIESASFKDTQMGDPYPEIIVHFKPSVFGSTPVYDSLDMSAALANYVACACGKCFTCVTGSPVPVLTASNVKNSPKVAGTYTLPGAINPFFGLNPTNGSIDVGIGFSIAGTNTGGFTGACKPDWKDYLGLNDSYKYCTRCNKKESEHS